MKVLYGFLYKLRGRFAHKLLNYFLRRRIDGRTAYFVFVPLFYILTKNRYALEHNKAKHHFVSKFLLRNFKITTSGEIYEYSSEHNPRRVSIKKQAALSENFYTFRDKKTKTPSDFMEKEIFARVLEPYTAKIIKRVLENGVVDLTNLERSILDSFVAFQYTRTPKFFALMENVITYLLVSGKLGSSEIKVKTFAKEVFIENRYACSRAKLIEFNGRNRTKVTGIDNLLLASFAQLANHIGPLIFYKHLALLQVENPRFFFTSDNPVVMFNVEERRFVGPFIWEIRQNSLVLLPLSPTECLCYGDNRLLVEDSGVMYNLFWELARDNAYQFIYADRITPDLRSRTLTN